MRKESDNRLLYLDTIRGLAIIFVICVHTLSYNAHLGEPIHKIVSFIVGTISVPIFFFVDGFLFSRIYSKKEHCYSNYLIKSAKRLIIPWLLFTCLYTFIRLVAEYYNVLQDRIIIGNSYQNILLILYTSQVSIQLYFLLSLFFVRILSCLTCLIVRSNLLITTMLCSAFVVLFRYYEHKIYGFFYVEGGFDPVFAGLVGLQYYLYGVLVERFLPIISRHSRFIVAVCVLLMPPLILFAYDTVVGKTIIDFIYLTSCFIFILVNVPEEKFFSRIGRRTMGIYLFHSPIIIKTFSLIALRYIFEPILSFMLIAGLTFTVSFLIAEVVSRNQIGGIILGESV